MQKLSKRKTYTPKDAPQVPGSVTTNLNKDQSLSDSSSKTFNNNSDVDQQSGMTEQNPRVFVLNMRGKPLMPTTPRKARHLLKQSKAVVVKRKPFTIQLTIATGETTQPITLGIDAGSRVVGFSAVTETKELVSGELELRTNVSKLLTERAMYRKNRRNKSWYRQKRFDNRVATKKKGWLAPSIQHKLDTHQRLIDKLKSLLPINNVVVEVAKFDAQKLQNADIKGIKYQQGQMSGYNNLRAFVFTRDKYTCQICKKQGGILQTHHIHQRKDSGSDRPDNLVTLHLKCHEDFHSGKIKHEFVKPKSFKDTVIMNNLWKRLVEKYNYNYTFGYITKENRQQLGLEKSHVNDAFVIAGGNKQNKCVSFVIKQQRRNNRCLQLNRKGFKPSIRRTRYKLQSKDLVKYNNEIHIIKGVCNYGNYVRLSNNKYVAASKVELIKHKPNWFLQNELEKNKTEAKC